MPKPINNKYYPGDPLIDCDVCGFTYHVSELRKGIMGTQIGLNVCEVDFDSIHPRENPPDLSPKRPLRKVE